MNLTFKEILTVLLSRYVALILIFFFLTLFSQCTTIDPIETPYFSYPSQDITLIYHIMDSIITDKITISCQTTPAKIILQYYKANNTYSLFYKNIEKTNPYFSSLSFLELKNLDLTPLFFLKNNQILGLTNKNNFNISIPNSLDLTFEKKILDPIDISYKNQLVKVTPISFNFYSDSLPSIYWVLYSTAEKILQATLIWKNLIHFNPIDSSTSYSYLQRVFTLQ